MVRTRRLVWALKNASPQCFPAQKVAGTDLDDMIVLHVQTTVVIANSEKEQATDVKRTFGYHPFGVWCDNTNE